MCDPDGSRQELLLELPPFVGFSIPDWSPNGARITVDAVFRTATRDVYIIDVTTKRAGPNLTEGGGRLPAWSRDGKSIYYNPGNTNAIWKLDIGSGEKRVLLDKYGSGPFAESYDSSTLYFLHGPELMKVALDGNGQVAGDPRTIAHEVVSFAVVKRGVYLNKESGAVPFYEEKGGAFRPVGTILPQAVGAHGGISVSADERWLLYTQSPPREWDLKRLESVP